MTIFLPEQQTTLAALEQISQGHWPRICAQRDQQPAMRVAMLSLHTSPLAAIGKSRDAGGMNIYVRELARHLGQRGIAVDIFTRWSAPDLPQIIDLAPHTRVIHIPAGPLAPIHKHYLPTYIPRFIAGIECFAITHRLDYDLIHSHYWLSGMAGAQLAERWRAPHLIMFHTLARLKQDARPQEQELPLRIEQERQLIHQADGIIAATDDERKKIARLYGVSGASIHIVPGGVDLQRFTPGDRLEARTRLEPLLDLHDAPLILCIGRLDPLKGPDLLVQALALMQTPAVLAIIGGDDRDPERGRLRALAAKLGVADRLRFVDAVPHDTLPLYYRAADVLAIASHYESFGLTAVEALACGTPVIAPAVGGLPTIIQSEVNGILLPRREPARFAARLDRLLGDAQEMARLRTHARASVTRFGWHRIAHHITDLYAQLCAAPPQLKQRA